MNENKSNNENEEQTPDYIGHRQRLKARFVVDKGRSMPDYELLELVLTYAIPRKDVKPLAKSLLKHYINLANILVAPTEELMNFPGIGSNAAILCSVIHACVNKICWENLDNNDIPVLTNKSKIAEYCRSRIGYAGQEQLLVIYLDTKGKFMRDSIEQAGTLNSVAISPAEIARKVLRYNAKSIIISHNHPSGDLTPSRADIDITMALRESLRTVDAKLIDHIIITQRGHFSMAEKIFHEH